MKRSIGLVLALIMVLAVVTGCSAKKSLKDENLAEICKLGQYKEIEISQKTIDDYVQTQIDSLLTSKKTTETVTDRAAQKGDTVSITYVGVSEGETFDEGEMDVEIGSNKAIAGFEEALIGFTIGETKDVELTFPESYPSNEALAGKPATFTITLDGIKASVLPELTDAFIAENTSYKTIEEYRTETANNYRKNTLWSKAIANAVIENYPTEYVKSYYDAQINSIKNSMAAYNMTLDQYISMYSMTNETFANQVIASAKNTVKQAIVVYLIADAENMTVSDEDFQAKVTSLAESYEATEDEVLKNITREDIELEILGDKALNLVDSTAKVTE